MNVRAWMDAMTVDEMIAIYLGLAVILALAILWQLIDVGIYSYRMRRAKKHARKVIEPDERFRQAR